MQTLIKINTPIKSLTVESSGASKLSGSSPFFITMYATIIANRNDIITTIMAEIIIAKKNGIIEGTFNPMRIEIIYPVIEINEKNKSVNAMVDSTFV